MIDSHLERGDHVLSETRQYSLRSLSCSQRADRVMTDPRPRVPPRQRPRWVPWMGWRACRWATPASILPASSDAMIQLRPGRSLRSLVALLTLASAGLAQSAILECPMELTAMGAGVEAQRPSHAAHAHQGHDSATEPDRWASSANSGSTSQPDSTCTMPIGCGAAGIHAPRVPAAPSGEPTVEALRTFVLQRYATVFLAHEPPPPRLPV